MSLIPFVALAVTLFAVSITDIRQRRIPNRVLMVAAGAAVVISALEGGFALAATLLAAAAVSSPLFVAAFLKPEGMGMGDAKLVAVIGLFLGWQALPALLLGLFTAGMAGVLISLGKRQPPSQTSLPLAPFLAVGALPVALFGLQALQ